MATRIRNYRICCGSFQTLSPHSGRYLGDRMEDVVLATMSEFGRTVEENGNAGTDHGQGSPVVVLGGRCPEARSTAGKWPGLEKEQLYEGRDLAVTTDFRAVLSELVRGHLGQNDLNAVFPGFQAGRAARTPCAHNWCNSSAPFASPVAFSGFGPMLFTGEQ